MNTDAGAVMPETERTTGTVMKRRGILAAAAAVVAGFVAKQTSQPVAANTDGLALIIAGSNSESTGTTVLTWTGTNLSSPMAALLVTDGGASSPYTAMVAGVATNAKSDYGVYGENGSVGIGGRSSIGYGVSGRSATSHGVYGRSDGDHAIYGDLFGNPNSGFAAVYGSGSGVGSFGVVGDAGAGGVSVQGQATGPNGTGVKGVAAAGFPMIGVVTGGNNGNAGVLGVGTAGPGVQGQSYAGHGLVGTTSAIDGIHTGLVGYVQPGSNAIAIRGTVASGAVGYAGIFDGDVLVNGALRVFGSPKNAAVKHPDGTYRLLYCMESPESWFEDFGTSKLVNGKAAITLDPDFTALVHTGEYMVYLTPQGDSKGLYVTDQTPVGFTVREQQGGTSGVGFAYRVVAKRKDIVGERLAKVAPPPALKAVQAFTVPEPPTAKPPTKKP